MAIFFFFFDIITLNQLKEIKLVTTFNYGKRYDILTGHFSKYPPGVKAQTPEHFYGNRLYIIYAIGIIKNMLTYLFLCGAFFFTFLLLYLSF